MVNKLLHLRNRLAVNTVQIQRLVAKKNGMSSLSDLSPADYQRLDILIENCFAIWKEAESEGNPSSQDDGAFNKLLLDRREIQMQIDAI